MELKRRTQIILALMLTSVFLFQNCATISGGTSERRFPERKHGALIITKKDGHKIEGELITVKPNALLLLDTEGWDVSVDIADIKVVRVVKKSKALLGAGLGLLICGGGAALYAYPRPPWEASRKEKFMWASLIGAIGGFAGLLIGGTAGKLVETDETIHFEGMTDLEIQEAMDKLRKKARIRDYK